MKKAAVMWLVGALAWVAPAAASNTVERTITKDRDYGATLSNGSQISVSPPDGHKWRLGQLVQAIEYPNPRSVAGCSFQVLVDGETIGRRTVTVTGNDYANTQVESMRGKWLRAHQTMELSFNFPPGAFVYNLNHEIELEVQQVRRAP